jgi:uncharacterized cupin superfamily protein
MKLFNFLGMMAAAATTVIAAQALAAEPMAKDQPAPVVNRVMIFATTEETAGRKDLRPSMPSSDGKGGIAFSRDIPSPPGLEMLRAGVTILQPGEYRHPGGSTAETFVVTHGRGRLRIIGGPEFILEPGVIMSYPAHTPQTMYVTELIRKVYIVPQDK